MILKPAGHTSLKFTTSCKFFSQVGLDLPGGQMGFVGVNYEIQIPGIKPVLRRHPPARRHRPRFDVPARPDPSHLGPQDQSRQGFDHTHPFDRAAKAKTQWTPRDQGVAASVIIQLPAKILQPMLLKATLSRWPKTAL